MTTLLSSAIRNVSLMAFALQVLSSSSAICQEPEPTITVTGEAEIHLEADEIVIHASIESRAKTAAEASKDNRDKSRTLLEFLKARSIEEKQIGSELPSIDIVIPEEEGRSTKGGLGTPVVEESLDEENALGSRRPPVGYRAYRNFTIIVKDLKRFEEIYQGIVENGINRVDTVTYRSSQEKAHGEKLRVQAVRVAKERAQALAQELNASLSSIQTIRKSSINLMSRGSRGVSYGRTGLRGGMGMIEFLDSTESTEGQIIIQSNVEVVFCLGNAELKEKE